MMTREKCIGQQGAMVVIKRSQIKSDRTRKLMPHALFSHNPEYCVDIIHAHKPAFTPPVRVFGTIGFIVAMWTVSLMGLELSS
ncbi:hypothetical protein MJM95_19785, partial [Salmonella enterica subsp. enterica serovar Anatum]|nr:hypothetical protein [Salmonella enterica subsp. enterica serovar Anatum]